MYSDWLRGLDLNQRPLGYEPNELPGCSTPQRQFINLTYHGQTNHRMGGKGREKCPFPRLTLLLKQEGLMDSRCSTAMAKPGRTALARGRHANRILRAPAGFTNLCQIDVRHIDSDKGRGLLD